MESLRQFALTHLPAWQVPREWWKVDSLAANGRGKLSRAEWRKRYLEENPKAEIRRPKEGRSPKPEVRKTNNKVTK